MKLLPRRPNRRRTSGFATVVVLTLLAIMALLLAINADSVRRAHREVRLVDQRQLQQPWLRTNSVPALAPKP
jgi:type II secretory pathway component PulK